MRDHRHTRDIIAFFALLMVGLFTASCSTTEEPSSEPTGAESWLGDYDLDGLDAREITEHLDTLPLEERPAGLIASVEPETLVLFDDRDNETSMPLPEDEFYLSFPRT